MNPFNSLLSRIKAGEIHTVMLVFPDMQGRWMGKRATARYFAESIVKHGTHACSYLLTVDMEMDPVPGFELTSWDRGYQDFCLLPDPATLHYPAWLPGSALLICDLVDDKNNPIEVSPRRILRHQIERAEKMGFSLQMASELEFYLFRETYETARSKNYHGLENFGHYIEDYHMLQGTKEEPVIGEIRNRMEESGIPVETSKGEWGPGQHEINLSYSSPLEMADRHTIYKHGAKEIAMAQGLSLTFMAKYDAALAGSSCHIHASLWDKGGKKALFSEGGKPGKFFRQFLAGNMALAREFSIFYAPSINSYKRYQSSTFAPTRIAWGEDNRTCGFRIVGEGRSLRIENRIPGADANPYLAFAATIASGLYGIQKKLDPPSELHGNAYEEARAQSVPKTLNEASAEFSKSKAAREAFGDTVVKHYLHAAQAEQASFDKTVTCWEKARYFERI